VLPPRLAENLRASGREPEALEVQSGPEIHRVDPDFGSTFTVSSREYQSKCWVNWKITGQPCDFQVQTTVNVHNLVTHEGSSFNRARAQPLGGGHPSEAVASFESTAFPPHRADLYMDIVPGETERSAACKDMTLRVATT
jgi:hypothetical protein